MAAESDIGKMLKSIRGYGGRRSISPEASLDGAAKQYGNILQGGRRLRGASKAAKSSYSSTLSAAEEAYLDIQRAAMRSKDIWAKDIVAAGLVDPELAPSSATSSKSASGLLNTNAGPVSTPDRLIPSSPQASTGPGPKAGGYTAPTPYEPRKWPKGMQEPLLEGTTEIGTKGLTPRERLVSPSGAPPYGDGPTDWSRTASADSTIRDMSRRDLNIYDDYIQGKDVDMDGRLTGKEAKKAPKPDWRKPADTSGYKGTGPATIDKRRPLSPNTKRTQALKQNTENKKSPAKLKKDQAKFAAKIKAQRGFIDPRLLKDLGRVGLLGAGTAALEYLDPDNPIALSRQRGYELTDEIGDMFGIDGVKGGIEGMDPSSFKTLASIADSMLLDPVVSVLGAGANMGDRLYNEITGTNKKSKFKRGKGLGGRINRGLINGS